MNGTGTGSSGLVLAYLPSPARGVWHLGPFPVRAYALCIVAGIIAALVIGERRWTARGGSPGQITDIAMWAVPFGIIGGRAYHVATDPELYFTTGHNPWRAFAIWDGGLGIWGAIALGGVGAAIACRRAGIELPALADTVAPAIAVAQGIGRWGNWFNQELFGRATTLPWALRIDPAHRPPDTPGQGTYHPTFLYESLWDLGVAGLVVWAERRFGLGRGRAFALYLAAYTTGRLWIEALRVDHANHILGLRLNIFTCLILLAVALLYLTLRRDPQTPARTRPARPTRGAAPDAGHAVPTPRHPSHEVDHE